MRRSMDTVGGVTCRHPHMDHGSHIPGSQATTYYSCERTSTLSTLRTPKSAYPGVFLTLVLIFYVGLLATDLQVGCIDRVLFPNIPEISRIREISFPKFPATPKRVGENGNSPANNLCARGSTGVNQTLCVHFR
jgi:hypothetical protein